MFSSLSTLPPISTPLKGSVKLIRHTYLFYRLFLDTLNKIRKQRGPGGHNPSFSLKRDVLPSMAQIYANMEELKVVSEKEHIRQAPDMYIDSKEKIPRTEYMLVNGKVVLGRTDIPIAVIRIFMEVFANALDASSRSSRMNVDPGKIEVTINRDTVTVSNGGIPIRVAMHSVGMLEPEVVFGTLHSSTNFTEERHEIGRNGLGSKLANIFSTWFNAEVLNVPYKKMWKGTWINGMEQQIDRVYEDYTGTENKVSVSYKLDFNYFNLPGGYPDEMFYIISRICADASFTNKIPVYFNGTLYNYRLATDYATLFCPSETKIITYYEWPLNTNIMTDEKGNELSLDGYTLPRIEMIAFDTPDGAFNISFVNSMMTSDGGSHVETAIKTLSDSICNMVNNPSKTIKKGTAPKTSKATSKNSKDTLKEPPKITLADVRPHLSVVIAIRVVNPTFASQTKTLYRGPGISLHIPSSLTNKMREWRMYEHLVRLIQAKRGKIMSKIDGAKKKHLTDCKVIDANYAGTRNSSEAILFITEGKSAKECIYVMRRCHPQGADVIGALPIQGKLINTISNKIEDIADNVEIKEITKALGLKHGVDYTIKKNLDDLRYGAVFIMADQDVDGRHIKGLALLFFNTYYPTLLKAGFVYEYVTPYLRLFKTINGVKTELKFFYEYEYNNFLANNNREDVKSWHHKYCKGLASSSPSEVISDFKEPKILQIKSDDCADFSLNVAFNKTDQFVKFRRMMIENYDKMRIPDPYPGYQSITEYVADEHTVYSVANVRRHIPSIYDGLKPSQRKLLCAAFTKMGKKLEHNKSTSVRTFCSYAIDLLQYHHGDVFDDVLGGMCAQYQGKNNLRFFEPESLLGCRIDGGKGAAAARYTSFRAEDWLPYMFRPEDNKLLTWLEDEGQQIEPENYLSVICPIYNGVSGCGSGNSTFIPNFDVFDLINATRAYIKGEQYPPLVPKYVDFTGHISVSDKRKTTNMDGIYFMDDEDVDDGGKFVSEGIDIKDEDKLEKKVGKYSVMTTGVCHQGEGNNIIITELPIGVWTQTYIDWLKKLINQKRLTDYRDLSNDVVVNIELIGFKPPPPKISEDGKVKPAPTFIDAGMLRLKRAYGLTNMRLLNCRSMMKFSSPDDIVKRFNDLRAVYYVKRKDMMLAEIKEKIDELENKYKFLYYVLSGTLKLSDGSNSRRKADIYRDMDALGIDRKHAKTGFIGISYENLEKLVVQINEKKEKYHNLYMTHPNNLWWSDLNDLEEVCIKHYKRTSATGLSNVSNERILSISANGKVKTKRKARAKKEKTPIFGGVTVESSPTIVIED